MKPVYTPFTYVSERLIRRIYASMGPFLLLQPVSGNEPPPVKQAAVSGQIDVRAPVRGGEAEILEATEKFRSWGIAHEGHLDVFKTMAENYDDEAFAAEIRSNILRGGPRVESGDPMTTARLFLALAQEFDMQQAELNTELQAAEVSRRKMFAELKGAGDNRHVFFGSEAGADPGHYLTARRITCWLRLLTAEPQPSRIWVTTSRAVFDFVLEFIPGARLFDPVFPLPETEAFKCDVIAYLSALIDANTPEAIDVPYAEDQADRQAMRPLAVAHLPVASPAAVLDLLLSESAGHWSLSEPEAGIVLVFLDANVSQ